MEGLLLESLAAEIDRDRARRARATRVARRATRTPRRPAGSWVLAGSLATWLGR